MEETIRISGVGYKVVQSDEVNPFERMDSVKSGEAVRYFSNYMYRTASGEARMCDAECPDNNWGV